jgi:hypothetical protein
MPLTKVLLQGGWILKHQLWATTSSKSGLTNKARQKFLTSLSEQNQATVRADGYKRSPLQQYLSRYLQAYPMKLDNSSLTTIDELYDLVDSDESDHKLKDIARLFLEASNDWPTSNQTLISEFVQELKQYFGTPLTKKKILEKTFDHSTNNVWRHEAGSSLIEMFEISDQFYSQPDFDKILQNIISYYEQHSKKY